jgi:hypothetical protein
MGNKPVLLLALSLLLCGQAACAKKKPAPVVPAISRIELYEYSPASSLEDRIKAMPPKVLEFYRQMDGRPDYKTYLPTPADKALLLSYLRLMPPAVERVFREKCVGLYFVEGFAGNGMTNWVADEKGGLYFHMALNPAGLRQTLSETLTERERSCFLPARGAGVTVDAGKKYKGLAYAVFHEAAHAADYIYGLTPMVDPDLPPAYRPAPRPDGGLFGKVWELYRTTRPPGAYPWREKLTFYGLGGGPKLTLAEAPGVYKGLAASPFVSLYGSKSWAEDFAELTAYYLITVKLGQPYAITVAGPGLKTIRLEPMTGPAAARAAAAAELLRKL